MSYYKHSNSYSLSAKLVKSYHTAFETSCGSPFVPIHFSVWYLFALNATHISTLFVKHYLDL